MYIHFFESTWPTGNKRSTDSHTAHAGQRMLNETKIFYRIHKRAVYREGKNGLYTFNETKI